MEGFVGKKEGLPWRAEARDYPEVGSPRFLDWFWRIPFPIRSLSFHI